MQQTQTKMIRYFKNTVMWYLSQNPVSIALPGDSWYGYEYMSPKTIWLQHTFADKQLLTNNTLSLKPLISFGL